MDLSSHWQKLERMYLQAPINAFYRPTIGIGQGASEIAIEVREDFFHAARAVHGSVYFKLMDDAAYFAAQSMETRFFLLTASFTTYFSRPVTAGSMLARGRLLHRGRSQVLAEATVVDRAGREVARGSGLFAPSRIALETVSGFESA